MDEDELDAVLASVPMPCDHDPSSSSTASLPGTDDTTVTAVPAESGDDLGTIAEGGGTSKPGSSSSKGILVNPRQRGNPVLKHIRAVPWEYDVEIIPDYVMGVSSCALFLSIRYYNLHPDYIHERLKELKYAYALRVLLVLVDVQDPYPMLKTLTHIGMLADLTIIPCHSAEEAGRILENYKVYENKPSDMIQEKQDSSSTQQVIDALTSIRSVNKTDAVTLLRVFGTLANVIEAPPERIALCPGIGPQKAQRIHAALHEPFKNTF